MLALWGERLRRAALGLTAALIAARSYWPAEYHDEANSGDGLGWTLAVLVASALAVLAGFVGGRLRLRLAPADLVILLLFSLVGLSAQHAAAPRVALNLAWEWLAVGGLYVLIRQLPRSRDESQALAAVFAATAVALASYGLYQVTVVQPEMRRLYRENPELTLRSAGIPPENPVARRQFEDRLLGSKEPTSTLALTNSLAGVLVAPLVVGLGVALSLGAGLGGAASQRCRSRLVPILMSAVPGLALLTCLLLTKSRSAYLGLIAGVLVLAAGLMRRVALRRLALAGLGLALIVAGLAAVGVATGQLDGQVLSESSKSLRYRAEYWAGTWRILWDPTLGGPATWWNGLGPGNFAGPYLRAKLPQASESISDPHNLLLEVWVTAGLLALLALVAGLGLAGWDLFGPGRGDEDAEAEADEAGLTSRRCAWLVAAGGVGGLLLAMILTPALAGDTWRLLVLGAGWLVALLAGPLWRAATISSWALGAGTVALAVNLLAAGGIGFAPVALMLWGLIAVGLNLRADRPCSRLRALGDRPGTVVAAVVWSILAGTFAGTIGPHWSAQAALAQGEQLQARARQTYGRALAIQPASRPADERAAAAFEAAVLEYTSAVDAFRTAARLDRLAVRPWHARAQLEHEAWRAQGAPTRPDTLVWHQIDSALKQAITPPRDPNDLATQTLRAQLSADLLNRDGWPEFERDRLQADHLDALRQLARLNPTAAPVHAELALALARAGQTAEAVAPAERALDLDRTTPHADRKLLEPTRKRLEANLARWRQEPATPPRPAG